MRISRHPYFVQLREQAGRQRDFRPEREKLLDAIVPLPVSTVDRATHIDTINLSKMAWQLSEKDSEGNVIRKVTVPRVCRLLQHMMEFGYWRCLKASHGTRLTASGSQACGADGTPLEDDRC